MRTPDGRTLAVKDAAKEQGLPARVVAQRMRAALPRDYNTVARETATVATELIDMVTVNKSNQGGEWQKIGEHLRFAAYAIRASEDIHCAPQSAAVVRALLHQLSELSHHAMGAMQQLAWIVAGAEALRDEEENRP